MRDDLDEDILFIKNAMSKSLIIVELLNLFLDQEFTN